MELNQFAEHILFGDSLADKLVAPGPLSDCCPGQPIKVPHQPGRPSDLRFRSDSPRAEPNLQSKHEFPADHELFDDLQRGRVLHFFANHELLALELMALVLLRFPDAPRAFRRSLAQTMRDEQKHLSLYIEHMERLGTHFGSLPVNSFFWRALSDIDSPLAFVSRMSLTLEQANLDFALHYRERFSAVGDEKSAFVMDEVFRDEIRHVRHGLEWLRRWKPPAQTDWQAFEASLAFPITACRAKGLNFSADARRQVGFDEDFIRRLRLFQRSKGRPPRVWVYNPAQEFEVGAPGLSYSQSALLADLGKDLETLLITLCAKDDVVALRRPISDAWAEAFAKLGLTVPEQVHFDDSRKRIDWAPNRRFSGMVPWGASPQVARIEAKMRQQASPTLAPNHPNITATPQSYIFPKEWKKLVSKAYAARLRKTINRQVFRCAGSESAAGNDRNASACAVADTFEDAMNWAVQFGVDRGQEVVFKNCFSSAGHGQLRVRSFPCSAHEASWLRRTLSLHGECIVEPLRDIKVEVSVQCHIDDWGKTRIIGMNRNLAARNGQYLASAAGRFMWNLPPEVVRHLYAGKFLVRLEQAAMLAGSELATGGYRGPFGVDGYVFAHRDGTLDDNLLGEINLRYTMGRVALALRKRALPCKTTLLTLLPAPRIDAAQSALTKAFGPRGEMTWHSSAAGFAAIAGDCDIDFTKRLMASGWFFLNDPEQAHRVVPLVWVGDPARANECLEIMAL